LLPQAVKVPLQVLVKKDCRIYVCINNILGVLLADVDHELRLSLSAIRHRTSEHPAFARAAYGVTRLPYEE
jgi:hypothetical protein